MNQVKTYVDKSPIHGLGLFAAEDIPKGTIIWSFEYPDINVDYNHYLTVVKPTMSEQTAWYFEQYCSIKDNVLTFYADDAKYGNHSFIPNTYTDSEGKQIAKEDILKGQEITCNYNEFHDFKEEYM